jgi:fumarate reductase flavoprotein subunit
VNKLGRRFIDETTGAHMQTGSNALLSQPGRIAWSIWDDDLVEEAMKNGFVLPRYPGHITTENLREKFQDVASRKEWAIKSDSWDEIAKWIGAPAKTLKATVEEFNSFCDHGYDETFVKDRRYLRPVRKPPFYAVKFGVMVVDTCGPIRVNEAMEVLDAEHHPIPGLFAAGVTVSGWQGHDYCGDLMFASALGFSVNSGRIAGESAAQWVLGSGAK